MMDIKLVISKNIKRLLRLFKKWQKCLAVLFILLTFCSVIVISVLGTCRGSSKIIAELDVTSDIEDKLREIESNYCYLDEILENNSPCTVRCSNIEDIQIAPAFNELDLSECVISEIDIILDEVFFTNNTITNGWLRNLSKDIGELTISSSLLTELGESAFSGKPFESLHSLVIADSRIRNLKKDTFQGSSIYSLQIRCITLGKINVEFNALEYLSNHLNVLQFSQCIYDSETIRNITGTGISIFNQLSTIDLSYNTFTNISDYSFIDTPQLISLYLMSNNIGTIGVNAFSGLGSSLQLLYLQTNKLKNLPDGIFEYFNRGGKIGIQNNPWVCDCDLLWFKEFYIKNIALYFENGSIPFICSPDYNYTDVEFCPSTTVTDNSTDSSTISVTSAQTTAETITTGTVTTTMIIPTTDDPNKFIYLNCTDISVFHDISLEGLDRIYSHSIRVRNGTINYIFYQIDGTPNFEIKVLNNLANDYLIWIDTRDWNNYGCVYNVQDIVVLNNLQYGRSYTICLLKEAADTVTPFDCTSLTVPLDWQNSAWILNKHMPLLIGGVIGTALAIILLTSIIMFYVIRQNPKMIRGNKRVIIVRNKSADALVIPRFKLQPYSPPSVYTNSGGYLTPINKMYEKINDRKFRSFNTVSEKYQDFNRPTSRHSRSSSYTFHSRRSVGSEVYEPPPLPPNHPSDRPCSSRKGSVYKR